MRKPPKPCEGVSYYTTSDGIRVARLHWSADESKNVKGSNGFKWLESTSKGWVGGIEGADWQQEYEINFKIQSGKKVYANWERTHHPYVTYEPDPGINPMAPVITKSWPIWIGMDWGLVNPTVFTVHAMQSRHRAYLFDEIVTEGESPSQVAERIREKWYFPHVRGYVGDPSIWRDMPSDRIKSGKRRLTSIGKMFREEGIYIQQGGNQAGVDKDFITLLDNNLWKNMAAPKWMISRDCTTTIENFRSLQWIENTTQVAKDNKPDPEKIRDKDVDAFDSCKYMLMTVDFEAPEDMEAPPMSFDYEMQRMMEEEDEGLSVFS